MRRRNLLTVGEKVNVEGYLAFEVLTPTSFKFTGKNSNTVQYSINGNAWQPLADATYTNTLNQGDKIYFKGTCTPISSAGIGTFASTGGTWNVKGTPMSLLYGDNFDGQTSLEGKDYVFLNLFYQCTSLKSAENLSLPATTLAPNCYNSMFRGCYNLTTAPSLPATTLATSCYTYMFQGCYSLKTPPSLPATRLAPNCYVYMFQGCTSLTTAPSLPATTLASSCYSYMFQACSSLKTPPSLPATTLAPSCYKEMFYACTSLTTAPSLPATTLATDCYSGIVRNTNLLPDCTNIDFSSPTVVASGGLRSLFYGTKLTDVQLDAILKSHGINNYSLPCTTLATGCYYGMFYACPSLTTAPSLPATTLATSCYNSMFHGCTSLTTAPSLPATVLTLQCYQYMFYQCANLSSITCLATNISAGSCTIGWVNGVASTGTFTTPSSTNWTTGVSGIPTGWTRIDA